MTKLLTPEQVAEHVGLSAFTVRAALRGGELVGSKIRGRWRVHPADLDQWISDARTDRDPRPTGPQVTPRVRQSMPAGGARQLLREHREGQRRAS